MRNPWAAGAVGALTGVFAAATVLLAYLQWAQGGYLLHRGWPDSALMLLATTAVTAGPGAFLMGVPLAAWIRRKANPRASALAFGVLAGLLPGLINYGLVTFLVLPFMTPDRLPFGVGILAAVAGGAGLGLGCAWYVTLPPGPS